MADLANESNAVQPWPNKDSEYELKETIGVGSIAHVHCAYCIPRCEKCVIKIIDISKCNTPTQNLLHQVQALSAYKHPNLVSYYTSFLVNDSMWLVMSFLEGGSLRDTIKYKVTKTNCKRGVLDEATIATVLKSVLRGLEYLNSKGQLHRDIKAANILVGDNGTVKITDFGISGLVPRRHELNQDEHDEFIGSAYWMAPEVMDPEQPSYTKADMWSVGIAAIEMATGNPPYYKYPPMKVVKLTLLDDPPNLDTGADQKDQYKLYGKTFRKFIATCLKKEAFRRPTVAQLLQHPFLRKAKDRKLITQTVISVGPSYAMRVQKFCHCTGSEESSDTDYPYEYYRSDFAHRAGVEASTVDSLGKYDSKRKPSGVKEVWSTVFRKRSKLGSSHVFETGKKVEQKDKDEGSELSIAGSVPDMSTRATEPPMPLHKLSSTDVDENSPSIQIVLRYRRSQGKLEDITFLFSPDNDTPEGVAGELVHAGLLKPADSVPVGKYLNRLIETDTKEPITFHLSCSVTAIELENIASPKEPPKLVPRQATADPVEYRTPFQLAKIQEQKAYERRRRYVLNALLFEETLI